MKNRNFYLLVLVFVVLISGYNFYQFLQGDSFLENNISPLALENIDALATGDWDDCPEPSKATRKTETTREVTDSNVCVIFGYLDQDIKKKQKFVDCDFDYGGSICCDESTGLISEEVISRTDVKCIHGSAN